MAKILKGKEFKQNLNLEELLDSELPSSVDSLSSEKGVVLDRESLELSEQAQKILEEARVDARQIRQEAREIYQKIQEEMEKSKQSGFEKGYQEGLGQGLEMLVRVKELRSKLFQDNEQEILRLIFEIARKIVGRELDENNKAILNVIRLALNDAVGEKVVVRVNPADYEKVKDFEEELAASAHDVRTIIFRERDDVKQGGCIIETEIGTIDAQLETQMNAIKKGLGLE